MQNISQRIADITSNPKPNYSLDGESYSWSEYMAMLIQQEFTLQQARQRADGPFEVRSRGI